MKVFYSFVFKLKLFKQRFVNYEVVASFLTALFLFGAAYTYNKNSVLFFVFAFLSIASLFSIWFYPRCIERLLRFFLGLAIKINSVNSYVLLGFVYFFFVFPVSIFFRLIGRDALSIKRVDKNTYWKTEEKQWESDSFKNQF